MKKKTIVLLVLCLFITLLISACKRPASKNPVQTPASVNQATALPVDAQIQNATVTAQAIMQNFNQPTALVQNPQGTPVVITQVPPTPLPTNTPSPTPMPSLAAMTRPTTWTVQGGETVYCLARRFNVDPNDMLAINGLNNYSMLRIGDELKVPQSGSFPGERQLLAHPDVWNVSPGETVYYIACEYGDVWPEHIIAVNGLQAPYSLNGFKTLQIP